MAQAALLALVGRTITGNFTWLGLVCLGTALHGKGRRMRMLWFVFLRTCGYLVVVRCGLGPICRAALTRFLNSNSNPQLLSAASAIPSTTSSFIVSVTKARSFAAEQQQQNKKASSSKQAVLLPHCSSSSSSISLEPAEFLHGQEAAAGGVHLQLGTAGGPCC